MESLSPTLMFVTHVGCTESALSFSSSLQSSVSRCTFVMESVAVNEIWANMVFAVVVDRVHSQKAAFVVYENEVPVGVTGPENDGGNCGR